MIDDRTQMLIATIRKLFHRGAEHNISRILNKTHAADVAAVLEAFPTLERTQIFGLEASIDKQAEILSHLSKNSQQEVIQSLTKKEVLKVVKEMDLDDAADLLGHLPDEESQDILGSMQKKESEEVADLMAYPEDSAGGLMSTQFLTFNKNLSVNEVVHTLQNNEDDSQLAFYIYVVNDNNQLVGVVSLKQLLLSKKNEVLKDIMQPDVVSVPIDMDQEDVAQVVERYDFLSIPVVDNSNTFTGVVTVDDILDVIREEAEGDLLKMGQAGYEIDATVFEHFKVRLPWLILAFVGGGVCFSIIYYSQIYDSLEGALKSSWMLAAFLPLLLTLGATAGNQSVAVSVGAIRSNKFEILGSMAHFFKELKLSVMMGAIFAGFVYISGFLILGKAQILETLSLAAFLQIIISILLGNLIPRGIHKLGAEAALFSIPIFTILIDVIAIIVLFALSQTVI